jgi:integrase
MAFKHKRIRVERGLYRSGDVYWACATPPRSRTAQWEKIGAVGIQQARRERDLFAYKLKSGQLTPAARRISIRALATEWFEHLDELEAAGELRHRTVRSYKEGIKLHVLPDWRGRDVRSIEAEQLVAWHERQRASGAAAWSIRARWMALRGLLAHATRMHYIAANPCDALTRRERPKPGRAKQRYLSETEIEQILEKSSGQPRLINALLIFSGLRASELLGLTWGDIDLQTRHIRVCYQMSRKGERVPVKTEAGRRDVVMMSELGRLLSSGKLASQFSGDNDLVIGNGVGRTLGYTRLRKAFATAAADAAVQGVSPHTCRHTFASILIDGGASVEFVSNQLGHASTKTTWDIYVHLFRAHEQADAAKEALDAAFGLMLRAAGDDTTDD